jgi:hypothetical protein
MASVAREKRATEHREPRKLTGIAGKASGWKPAASEGFDSLSGSVARFSRATSEQEVSDYYDTFESARELVDLHVGAVRPEDVSRLFKFVIERDA